MEFSIPALRIAFVLRAERLGRRRIADHTGLSEMSVRLELEQLRALGFIRMNRSGCQLTARGKRAFSGILDRVTHVQRLTLDGLRIDDVSVAAQLRAHLQLPEAWRLRDEAIREGASGLILLIRTKEEWAFTHNMEPVCIHAPRDAVRLDEAFSSVDTGQLCLIVSGATESVCAAGLWRVICVLSQKQE